MIAFASPSRSFSSLAIVAAAALLAGCSSGGGGGSPLATRDAATVVFASEDGATLLAAADDGKVERQLADAALTQVRRFAVSPDGGAVAYIADVDVQDEFDLYVVDIAGGAPRRLATAGPTGDVLDFTWAPDSQSLAYRATSPLDSTQADLFRVARDASSSYRVFASRPAIEVLTGGFAWSPDGRFLAFVTRNDLSRVRHMRSHVASSAVEGSASVLSVPTTRSISDYQFSPDSELLAVYTDGFAQVGQFEVFLCKGDGTGTPLRGNGAVGSSVQIGQYRWSPDGRWLAQVVLGYPQGLTTVGLNVVEVGAQISSHRVVTTPSVPSFAWAPSGGRLAFSADFDLGTNAPDGVLRLLQHDAVSGATTAIADTFAADETLRGTGFAWSTDGAHLTYRVQLPTGGERLYLTQPGGVLAQRLEVAPNALVGAIAWSPDGQRLGYLDNDVSQAFHPGEWHLVGADGAPLWRSGSFFTFDTSHRMRWTSDGKRAVFAVNATAGGAPDLLRSVQSDGGGETAVSLRAANSELSFELASGRL